MKVLKLTTKSQMKKFVNMTDSLYKGDAMFVPYMRGDLYKTLVKLCLQDKTYTALAVEEDGKFIARVLFTKQHSKQLNVECGYFSHFECVDSQQACNLIVEQMCFILKEQGAEHVEGTYFPFDQDNRRGIQICGFEDEPIILTSYNKPYYATLLENAGFTKDFDTVSYKMLPEQYQFDRVEKVREKLLERYGLYITHVDFKNLDKEIVDVHQIIERATNDIIFETAPTVEDLHRIVANWKSFLWEELILLARRKQDDKAVGVIMAIPNFYYVFRKMDGRLTPAALLKMLYYKNKITSVRAMLQYVVPEYQKTGVNHLLYHELFRVCQDYNINYLEAGTIMENNTDSRVNVEKAGGTLNKIFRLYGKKL